MMHVYYTNSYDINDLNATYGADVDLDGAVRISVVLCSNEHSTGIRGTLGPAHTTFTGGLRKTPDANT